MILIIQISHAQFSHDFVAMAEYFMDVRASIN